MEPLARRPTGQVIASSAQVEFGKLDESLHGLIAKTDVSVHR